MPSETVEAQGHLIDSGDLQAILTTIVEHGATYEIERFDVGRTNDDASRLTITVTRRHVDLARASPRKAVAVRLLRPRHAGCAAAHGRHATAPRRRISTRPPITAPRCGSTASGSRSSDQRMDAAIVVDGGARRAAASCATCAQGDRDRLRHARRARDAGRAVARRPTFGFMSNEVSSERRVETAVARVADADAATRAPGGGRIAFVAGPVVVHTGGTDYFCELIRLGYVDLLLSGNALAVHDIEFALSGTSLGIDLALGPSGRARPSQSHARDQRDPPRRRHRAGGRDAACSRRASCTRATCTTSATSSPARSETTVRCPRR